jgi:hypothetical protein
MVKARSVKHIGGLVDFEEEVLGKVVQFKAQATLIDNSGIGAYDYQDQHCFDRGHDYVAEFEVSELVDEEGKPFEPTMAELIENAIFDDKDLNEKICEKLGELITTDDGPDPDDQRDEDFTREVNR